MEIQTEPASYEPEMASGEPQPPAGAPATTHAWTLWGVVGLLWSRRRLIVGVTFLAAVASVIGSLMMPNWYQSEARVLLPEGGLSGGITAMLGKISPSAASLLGGGGDYTRYLAILNSGTVTGRVIEEFDLVARYENEDKKYPMDATVKKLAKYTDFEVDMEYDYLSISVEDKDPEFAAELANFYVEQLNEINEDLAIQDARLFRSYVEKRYNEVLAGLDSARMAMQRFQERHGVVELPAMAEAMLTSVAEQRAEAVALEIQYETLLQQYGPDNPQVQAARAAVASAERQERDLFSGRDRLMPVPMAELPALASEYARIYQDLLVNRAILEEAQPLYEQARFQEESQKVAVQVLDPAYPAERKARPKRSIIVISAVLSAFLVACLYVLGVAWWNRNGARITGELRRSRTLTA